MAAAITTAFGDGGPVFAIPLAVIMMMAMGTNISAYEPGSAELRSAVRYSMPNIAAAAILVLGSFLDDEIRVAAWLLGMAISIAATIAAGEGDWVVRSGHFAERHGLIVIIALGEVVVAIGIPVVEALSDGDGVPSSTILALAAAGTFAGLLWWSYFDRPSPGLELRAESLEGRELSRYVRDIYTYSHVAIVGGVILSAAALEEITLHPKDPLPQEFRLMLLGGLVCYLGGVVVAVFRAFRAMAWERLAFATVIAAVLGAASSWDAVALLIVIDVVLLAIVITEHLRVERPFRDRATA
jgi:low temperature requirement protein LtrA